VLITNPFAENREDLVKMGFMLILRVTKNQQIIKIFEHKRNAVIDGVHEALK